MITRGAQGTTRWWLVTFLVALIGAGSLGAAEGARCEMWIDLYAGEPTTYGQLVQDLAGVDVVYLGEKHTLERHHAIQEKILTSLAEQGPAVLALEQITRFQQPGVDRYNAGKIDFDELVERIDWEETWPRYQQYRVLVETAQRLGVPVIGLNAKPETVRAVARKRLEGLEEPVREQLPRHMQLRDPVYRKHLERVLSVHAHASSSPEVLEGMFQAQVARDETMAWTLVEYLSSDEGKGRQAIVVTGSGHVEQGMGVPSRVRRRMPGVSDRIVVMSDSGDVELSEAESMAVNEEFELTHADLRHLDAPLGDYLHVVALRDPAEPSRKDPEAEAEEEQE